VVSVVVGTAPLGVTMGPLPVPNGLGLRPDTIAELMDEASATGQIV
jgi:hypothetical protein